MNILFLILIFICSVQPIAQADGSRNFTNTGTQRISPGNINDVTTGDSTMVIWVKKGVSVDNDVAICKKRNATTVGFAGQALYFDNTAAPLFAVSDGTTGNSCKGKTASGNWEQYIVTWAGAGNRLTLFINTVSACVGPAVAINSLTNGFNFTMGNNGGAADEAFSGQLFGASFYPLVLNPVEMKELFWKPDSVFNDSQAHNFWPLWGQSGGNEKDYGDQNQTSAASGVGFSTDGPPVMFGSGLPL